MKEGQCKVKMCGLLFKMQEESFVVELFFLGRSMWRIKGHMRRNTVELGRIGSRSIVFK